MRTKKTMSQYTDWNPILKHIPDTNTKTILELGCGKGTKFLVDKFQQVISWETAHNDKWWNHSQNDYGKLSNWRGYFYDHAHWGFDTVDKIIAKSKGKNRSDTSALDRYWAALIDEVDMSTIDVAFVDQGFHQRGETVTKFIELNIPYIFWHDTNAGQAYGYNKLDIPPRYETIKTLKGQGTKLIGLVNE